MIAASRAYPKRLHGSKVLVRLECAAQLQTNKGRTNAKLFERDFPHHVEMIVPERKLPQRCEDHSSKLDDEDRDGN